MADTRTVNDPVQELAALRRVVDDLKSTLLTRVQRRPTGTIEPTLLTTAAAGALFLQGQTVSRSLYPALWQWVQDSGLVGVTTGAFGPGDGSTSFSLPDFRGRVVRGLDSGETILEQIGIDHTSDVPVHNHGFTTGPAGNHGGHFPTDTPFIAQGGSDLGLASWEAAGTGVADHTHGGTTDFTGNATIDIRQASVAVNWLIYT